MKWIRTSSATENAVSELMRLYNDKKVFSKDGKELQGEELQKVSLKVYRSLAADIRKTVGIDKKRAGEKPEIEGFLLFNLKILVHYSYCGTTHFGVYDTSTGECRYLGSRYTGLGGNCA